MRNKYIYGNWKMNQGLEDIENFFGSIGTSLNDTKTILGISPQFIHLTKCLELTKDSKIKIGSQNCSHKLSGAFTGDISPKSIKELGCDFTLVGHSERRSIFNESNELLNEKTLLALSVGLEVVFCIGETLEEREAGKLEEIVTTQIREGLKNVDPSLQDKVVIAYEPVWAIGTGVTATPEQAEEAHALIRNFIDKSTDFDADKMIILYGGSVKPANVEGLLSKENIDGALVGGASLKASDYSDLANLSSNL